MQITWVGLSLSWPKSVLMQRHFFVARFLNKVMLLPAANFCFLVAICICPSPDVVFVSGTACGVFAAEKWTA